MVRALYKTPFNGARIVQFSPEPLDARGPVGPEQGGAPRPHHGAGAPAPAAERRDDAGLRRARAIPEVAAFRHHW